MTAQVFLKQLKAIQTDISIKQDQLRTVSESLQSITPAYSEKIGSSGSRNPHSMSERICALIDLRQQLTDSIETLAAMQGSIIATINEIPDSEYRAILYWRYMKGLPWSEVAAKIHMTEDGIYKKHRRALAELEKTQSFKSWQLKAVADS